MARERASFRPILQSLKEKAVEKGYDQMTYTVGQVADITGVSRCTVYRRGYMPTNKSYQTLEAIALVMAEQSEG